MVNRTPNTREEQDDAYKPGALKKHEEAAAGGAPINNSTAPDQPSGTTSTATKDSAAKLLSTVQHAEAAPWQLKLAATAAGAATNKMSLLNKLGPLAGIIVTVVAIIAFIAAIAGSSLLFIQGKALLGVALDTAAPVMTLRTQKMLAYKLDAVKNGFAESADGKCNARCKFGTISDTMLRNLQANDFKVETEKKVGGRYVIKSLTFPGEVDPIKTGAEMTKAINDPRLAAMFNKVFSSKTAYFMNSRFGTTLRNLGLDKLSKVSGDTKAKVIASWRKFMGLPGESAAVDPNVKKAAQERARSGRLKPAFDALDRASARVSGSAANGIAAACTGYNAAKGVTLAIKTAKIAAASAFAMVFLNLADQLAANANPYPETVEFVANQYTQADTRKTITNSDGSVVDNAYYNKTGMDSVALKANTDGGDPGTLSGQDERSSMSPTGGFAKALSDMTSLVITGAVTLLVAHSLCVAAPTVGTVLQCADQILEVLALVIETAGTAAIAGAAVCLGKLVVTTVIAAVVLGTVVSAGTNSLVDDDLASFDETTVGPPNGALLSNGASRIYTNKAYAYGLQAGSAQQIKEFTLNTAPIKSQIAAVEQYEAQSTPFDITNQYSFLGSVAKSLNVTAFSSNTSLMSKVNMITSIIPSAFASLTTGAHAATGVLDADAKAARYSHCTDPAINALGAGCDSFGNESAVMNETALYADIDPVLNYMVSNKYITEDLKTVKNSDYERWIVNCSNRTEPIGETSASIDDAFVTDYDWRIGLKCQEDSEMISNFQTYRADSGVFYATDGTEEDDTAVATDDAQGLAQQIIDSGRVTDLSSDSDDGPGPQEIAQIKAIADGTATGNCLIDKKVLKVIAGMAKTHTIVISDISRICNGSNLSYSSGGHWDTPALAIDFDSIDGDGTPEDNASFVNETLSYVESGQHVYVGQVQCRAGGAIKPPDGVTISEFNDACGHLHLGIKP